MNKVTIMAAALSLTAMMLAPAVWADVTVIPGIHGNLIERDGRSVKLNDDGAVFQAKGLPDAKADNDGSVTIDARELELSATQRAEVSTYVTHLRVLKDNAMQVGLHAAHFAMDMLWDATIGLILHGEDQGKKIDARADKFAARVAAKVCKPIGVLHDEGLQLAKDVTQLKAYLPPIEDVDTCIENAQSDAASRAKQDFGSGFSSQER